MPPPDSGEPGWYPDPLGSSSQRYWDGNRWLTKVQGGGGKSVKDRWQGLSTLGKVGVSVGTVFVLLIIIGAAAGGGDSKTSGTTADTSTAASSEQGESSSADTSTASSEPGDSSSADRGEILGGDPSENATDSNTPSVGPNRSVEVDTLRWRLDGVKTSKTIGEQQYGLGAKANGIYVIVELSVTNNKSESVTLISEIVDLVAGEDTYSSDTEAEVALISSGGETFFLEDVGPGVTAKGSVGFDVAPAVLHEHPQLRFRELGFGSTHGYITLPPLGW